MKRLFFALLILALTASALPALAQGQFAEIAGVYELSSGVGAWFTQLTVLDDGSFAGYYQDTDYDPGELDGAPYEATVYRCAFSGQLGRPERAGGAELDCTVVLLDCEAGEPCVRDGALYVTTAPAGIALNDRLRCFAPGTAVSELPEEFLAWVRMREAGIRWDSIPYTGIYNVTSDAGFSACDGAEALPAGEAGGAQADGTVWSFITAAPETEPTHVPEATPEPAEPAPAFRGLEFPVQAEVVNCKTGVSLRSAPSTKATLLAEAPLGAIVTLYSNAAYQGGDRWFVDAAYNGQRGYICIEYLDVILPDGLHFRRDDLKGTAGTVSALNRGTDLIMRAGPGTGFDNLGLLFGGEVLGYLDEARQDASGTCWYRCSYYGSECWISAKYTVLTLNDGRTYTGSRGVF